MLVSLVAYVLCGAVAGVLAGLLGVGGGIVLVPLMVAIFPCHFPHCGCSRAVCAADGPRHIACQHHDHLHFQRAGT